LTWKKPVGQETLIKTLLQQKQSIIMRAWEVTAIRKAFPAAAFISVLLFSAVAGVTLVNLAMANFVAIAPDIEIYRPLPYYIEIYQNTTIMLQINVNVLKDSPEIIRISYSLDGNLNVTLTDLTKSDQLFAFGPDKTGYIFYGKAVLENLAEGNHTLKAYSLDAVGKEMSASTEFTIDTNYEYPKVTLILLSPQNQTYSTKEIPLIFAVNGQIRNAYYILDYKARDKVALSGNTTLTGLSNGSHNLHISVDTDRGHAAYITIFTINAAQASNFFFLTNPIFDIIIAVIIVTAFSIGLLVYFKKRHIEYGDKHE
jgi:hypothetical protein